MIHQEDRDYGRWIKRRPRGVFLIRDFHIDWPLMVGLIALSGFGLVVLYSAGGENMDLLIRQCIRLGIAFGVMLFMAQIAPHHLERWTPLLFGVGLAMLVAVLVFGTMGKGAQRWLDLGFFRFQPSEVMKLALPMMVAWYLAENTLPPKRKVIAISLMIIFVPTLLILKQPDLGTSLLIASAGAAVTRFCRTGFQLHPEHGSGHSACTIQREQQVYRLAVGLARETVLSRQPQHRPVVR